ncbi:GIY-YIG nuclease family protein [Patescibacteria group bacterium]|nr:GIY-YIG nuclease family protein [Patescibacteria group bacterium]
MFYTYILESLKDGKLYIGYTNNLRRRFKEHNNGKSFATAHRKPFNLIYYEAYLNKEDAKEREKFFKTGWGRQYIGKKLKHYFLSKT